jgi:hypothetical protein
VASHSALSSFYLGLSQSVFWDIGIKLIDSLSFVNCPLLVIPTYRATR